MTTETLTVIVIIHYFRSRLVGGRKHQTRRKQESQKSPISLPLESKVLWRSQSEWKVFKPLCLWVCWFSLFGSRACVLRTIHALLSLSLSLSLCLSESLSVPLCLCLSHSLSHTHTVLIRKTDVTSWVSEHVFQTSTILSHFLSAPSPNVPFKCHHLFQCCMLPLLQIIHGHFHLWVEAVLAEPKNSWEVLIKSFIPKENCEVIPE